MGKENSIDLFKLEEKFENFNEYLNSSEEDLIILQEIRDINID